jgi:hypothetical protein
MLVVCLLALVTLKRQRRLAMNIQTVGLCGAGFYCIATLNYWTVDPQLKYGYYSVALDSFLYWVGDLGILTSFNVFFLYWMDLSTSNKIGNASSSNRFVKGKGVRYAILCTICFMLLFLGICSFILQDSSYYAIMYGSYSLVITLSMLRFGYLLNKKLKAIDALATEHRKSASVVSDPGKALRDRLNKIAGLTVGANLIVLTISLLAITTFDEASEIGYWTVLVWSKFIAACICSLMIWSFFPKHVLHTAKTLFTKGATTPHTHQPTRFGGFTGKRTTMRTHTKSTFTHSPRGGGAYGSHVTFFSKRSSPGGTGGTTPVTLTVPGTTESASPASPAVVTLEMETEEKKQTVISPPISPHVKPEADIIVLEA